jgi:hypothetical protein
MKRLLMAIFWMEGTKSLKSAITVAKHVNQILIAWNATIRKTIFT